MTSTEVLFIAGWGRSGSTLLDRLLGQMPGAVSVGELRDIWQRGVVEDRTCGCGERFRSCPLWREVGRVAFGGWAALDVERAQALRRVVDRPWMLPALVSPTSAPSALRRRIEEYADLVRRLHAGVREVSGGRLVVDSTKIPTWSLLLRLAGVEQSVVHLVRDSRGVVHSWRKQVPRGDGSGGGSGGGPAQDDAMLRYGAVAGSLRYDLYNAATHVLPAVGLPYRRVRYEDLVGDPVGTLRLVAGDVSLPLDEEVLRALAGGTARLSRTHTVDGNPHRLSTGPLVLRVDDAWRRTLPRRPRAVTTVLTAPLLLGYGYGGPVRAGGSAGGPVTVPGSGERL